jgi:hypothetical protein
MKLLTRAFILDNYGIRLNIANLSKLLGMAEGTIRNQIGDEIFPIPTYKEGAQRFASYESVADYLDDMAEKARRQIA